MTVESDPAKRGISDVDIVDSFREGVHVVPCFLQEGRS
jgi:hypothetical protein